MKPYSKTEDIVYKLGEMINELRKKDNSFLPSERKLCEILNTSRVTLRRALAKLEEQNLLQTGPQSRLITGKKALKTKGLISFVALGYKIITFPAWNRLWLKLNDQAEASGYRTRLHLYNEYENFDLHALEDSDYIVFCALDSYQDSELFKFLEGKPNVIGIDDSLEGYVDNVIAVDNFQAGIMAADELLKRSYRNPGFIGWNNSYKGFEKRCDGFCSRLREAGIKPDLIWLEGRRTVDFIKEFLMNSDHLIRPGLDSLFICSDESIGLFYDTMAHIHKIPDEFGLITVGGSHQSLTNHPPVDALSHATGKVSALIFSLIDEMKDGKAKRRNTILVQPSLHEGMTLRKRNE